MTLADFSSRHNLNVKKKSVLTIYAKWPSIRSVVLISRWFNGNFRNLIILPEIVYLTYLIKIGFIILVMLSICIPTNHLGSRGQFQVPGAVMLSWVVRGISRESWAHALDPWVSSVFQQYTNPQDVYTVKNHSRIGSHQLFALPISLVGCKQL